MRGEAASKRIFFLVNPKAGGGSAEVWWEITRKGLDSRGYDYFWEYSRPGEVGEQARRAVLEGGAQAVAPIGGDGTFYDALNGLIENDRPIREGILFIASAAGSGCDFARTVYGGTETDIFQLLEQGQARPIDVGRCLFQGPEGESRLSYFVNSFDAGAGAETCVKVNQKGGGIKQIFGGKLSFMFSALSVLMSFKYAKTRVEVDDAVHQGEYIIMAVGNGQYMGGSMRMFPQARLDDGLLDVLLVERRNRLSILLVFGRVYTGTVEGLSGVVACRGRRVRLSSDPPIAVEMDGEVPGRTQAEVTVLPGLINLLMPPDRP